jgi:hypothetical protein
MQDRRKQELCRLFEVANIQLAETRDLIRQIYGEASAEKIRYRVARLQENIKELKKLVKS